MFRAETNLTGVLRVDLPVGFARNVVIPQLPHFLALHPALRIQLSSTDRKVDLVRDGFDCVLRVGAIHDESLNARRIGSLPMVNCASPDYLARNGTPKTPDDLTHHQLIHYALRFGEDTPAFEWHRNGETHHIPMRSPLAVNSVDAYYAACLAGLGIIQAPRLGVETAFSDRSLVEILREWHAPALPVAIVHRYGRSMPRRVRVFVDWLAHTVRQRISP